MLFRSLYVPSASRHDCQLPSRMFLEFFEYEVNCADAIAATNTMTIVTVETAVDRFVTNSEYHSSLC